MLKTKSIQLPKSKSDGIRICIMRRPDEGLDWDIWIPHLAPSHALLTKYHNGEVSWSRFVEIFSNEVLIRKAEYVDLVAELSQKRTITLLCWETSPEMCHRRLVAEELLKKYPDLSVKVL